MDPSPPPSSSNPDLGWSHVGFGLTFVALNAVLSHVLQLHIGTSLVIGALRCVVQLTLVATVLQRVFAAESIWAVAGIALLLNTLGTFETVVIKADRKCRHMFSAVLVAMLAGTIPISILGARFAMDVVPFWTPEQYIPVVGMLCGNAIVGVSVALSYILKELDENRDKTETLLAFGASRFEACRPLAVEALRLSLMPTINQMRADVQQAARLQMIIMFMIAASSGLSSIITTMFVLSVCVDSEHRIRKDRIRIEVRRYALRRTRSEVMRVISGTTASWAAWARVVVGRKGKGGNRGIESEESERAPLLN
ncbi:hypothetical protein B0F90DRAFT_1697057 [Multifurca ochricompacta]|uniref:Uncharacterized protein n=1 Tax=Multifurca ochricompacta TaxID=376703 RepID=A0AAD4M9C9_9AGAM|nr:hypothetical protein B0F90DRAFT_1697057 [Multifurca ochricompacta]